ncbi:hypothetical protein OH491_22390 [Termitidicoccus mucosus]|uniref:Uncharacterized protein n=1 Tax=Termitidicoccus mucosus TaxID=1184151 RepID=A0A178IMZ5_9BACT|nr:hypothetical protein AW736_04085 [Opitutaceae bacterium TSB47]
MTTETTCVLETLHLPQGRKRASVHRELLHHIETGETMLFRFLHGYLTAALWTSHDDNEKYFDATHAIEDISIASLVSAWAECSQFCRECKTDLCHLDDERNGHNFWLTRCGHGSGYFDESVNDELAEFAMQQLTRASESFGEVDLYIGDDRKLHFSNESRVA